MRSATLLHLRSLKVAQTAAPLAAARSWPGSQQTRQASAGRSTRRALCGSRRCDSARVSQTAVCATRQQPTSEAATLRVARQRCCSAMRSSLMSGTAEPADLRRGISCLTVAAAPGSPSATGLAPDRLLQVMLVIRCGATKSLHDILPFCLSTCKGWSQRPTLSSWHCVADTAECCRSRCQC